MRVRRKARLAAAGAVGAGAVAATLVAPATAGVAVPAPAVSVERLAQAPGRVDIGRAPTTDTLPYVLPVAPGVSVTSHFTVNDGVTAGNGYRMVGIPDGLGAYRQGGDAVVLNNHELRPTAGIVRAHGHKGAFVSRLVLDRKTGAVKSGRDLIQDVRYFNYGSGRYADAPGAPAGAAPDTHTAAFSRFCSGFLSEAGQFYNSRTGRGTRQRVYFANEENGDEGRNFGVTMDGLATQLPRLGLFSWENTLAAANRSNRTVTVGNEDGGEGQLWVYAGTKTKRGSVVERAGLTNGRNYVIDALDEAVSDDAALRAKYGKGRAVPVNLSEVGFNQSGKAQNAEAKAEGLSLNRIEDGNFDPRHRNDYYFTTTEGGSKAENPALPGVSRDGGGLWRLRFRDIERPELGGTLTLLLDGSERPFLSKPDNMTIDGKGNILIQEDPGGNDAVARIVAYRISDGARGVVAQFDRGLFGARNEAAEDEDDRAVFTTDEESSGIIDASAVLGKANTFLFDAQVHSAKALPAGTGPGTVEEYVENGQLLSMTVRSWSRVYTLR